MRSWGYSRSLIPGPSPQVEKGEGEETNCFYMNPVYESGRDFCL